MPSNQDFQSALAQLVDRAASQGRPHVEVNAGELHRLVGGYPSQKHRMPICCSVMHRLYDESRDAVIFAPEQGHGASLTIQYVLPR